MDYSLVQALKYASTDLHFGRLLDRLVSKQATLSEGPAEGNYYWLQEIRKADPNASGDSVGHLLSAAKVLAGTADHSALPASFHSDNSPLGQFLKTRLQAKPQVPTGKVSDLEPLSLSVEPPPSPKVPPSMNALKTKQQRRLQARANQPAPPTELAAALRNRPISKE